MRKYPFTFAILGVLTLCSFRLLTNSGLDPFTISGVFRVNKVVTENFRGQSYFTKYFVTAYFPTDTVGVISIRNRKFGGTVIVNTDSIPYKNAFQLYNDTSLDLSNTSGFIWNIGGTNLVDSFGYVNSIGIPSFDYTQLVLPADLDTSQDLSIQLGSLSTTDSVIITFSRADSVLTPPFIVKRFDNGIDTITIEKKLLQQYVVGQDLYMQISLNNYNLQTILGKNYYFINTLEYRKKVTITSGP